MYFSRDLLIPRVEVIRISLLLIYSTAQMNTFRVYVVAEGKIHESKTIYQSKGFDLHLVSRPVLISFVRNVKRLLFISDAFRYGNHLLNTLITKMFGAKIFSVNKCSVGFLSNHRKFR